MTRGRCRIFTVVFALLYGLALLLWVLGTFGLFGVERDPLSGAYLLPLGLPWVLAVDLFPEPARPWLALACPAITLILLVWLCRRLR